MHTLRTRFKKEIIAEFLPPQRKTRAQRVVIFADGMPSVPSKKHLLEFFAKKGFWVFHPRYRGSWESGGRFLKISPDKDIIDLIAELPRGFRDIYHNRTYKVKPDSIFLIGSSFGGTAVILASRDRRVARAVAFSPVINWQAQDKTTEPINWMQKFTRSAFGEGYRFSTRDWSKLKSGKFYSPLAEAAKIDGKKVLVIHAKDDKVVNWKPTQKFANMTGAKTIFLKKGSHLSLLNAIKPRFYARIVKFFRDE